MKAKEQKWCAGERQILANRVPLETPISLLIEPSSFCNYKCYYCLRNLPRENVCESCNMSFEMFKKIIDDVQKFPQKISAINLAGNGEPLINPMLPEMIRYAKKMDVCNIIKVITNGSLLNEEIGRSLIDAGLDVLRISLQGMDSQKVKEVCGYDLDYTKFVNNIEFFYKNRKQCKLYVRILDEHISDKESFYSVYENICDELFVEHVCDFTMSDTGDATVKNMMQEEVKPIEICSYPFYQFAIGADGKLYPCSIRLGEKDSAIGNVLDEDLSEFWNGKRYSEFRLNCLNDRIDKCSQCNISRMTLQKEDNIDECKGKLIAYYKKTLSQGV